MPRNEALPTAPPFPQFWDGRAATLEHQAKGPIANPIEMGNTHHAMEVRETRSRTEVRSMSPGYQRKNLDEKIKKLDLTAGQKEDLVELLRALDGAPIKLIVPAAFPD